MLQYYSHTASLLIPKILTIPAFVVLDIGVEYELQLIGLLSAGFVCSWTNVGAVLDIKTPSQSSLLGNWGLADNCKRVLDAEVSLKVVIEPFVKLALQVKVSLLSGITDKLSGQVALVEKVSIKLTGSVSSEIDGSCPPFDPRFRGELRSVLSVEAKAPGLGIKEAANLHSPFVLRLFDLCLPIPGLFTGNEDAGVTGPTSSQNGGSTEVVPSDDGPAGGLNHGGEGFADVPGPTSSQDGGSTQSVPGDDGIGAGPDHHGEGFADATSSENDGSNEVVPGHDGNGGGGVNNHGEATSVIGSTSSQNGGSTEFVPGDDGTGGGLNNHGEGFKRQNQVRAAPPPLVKTTILWEEMGKLVTWDVDGNVVTRDIVDSDNLPDWNSQRKVTYSTSKGALLCAASNFISDLGFAKLETRKELPDDYIKLGLGRPANVSSGLVATDTIDAYYPMVCILADGQGHLYVTNFTSGAPEIPADVAELLFGGVGDQPYCGYPFLTQLFGKS
ncbi:hypothetical protein C8R43DRAFT_956774 [Mycena crocata]|nr:hypothetical protein C8R43DRAFT_956774 [Mycena crocata]